MESSFQSAKDVRAFFKSGRRVSHTAGLRGWQHVHRLIRGSSKTRQISVSVVENPDRKAN